ncbi:MAG: histidine--tRNA ligase [Gemmatimonadetes bacterium]|nr:histidine--tRNA ligase [Gemmatimonadota bacterium]
MSPKPLPGFRDFYPDALAERAHIFDSWRRVVRRYAFQEYDGPPLEPLELYTQKSGDEIVGQLYNFTDKGDRAVALRPEMTPTFARMVAAKAQALRKPVRWFSIPQLFRYERTQKGRLREHYQLNVDLVGETDVLADAELLSVAIDIMRELGLTSQDVRARVSDRRLLNGLLAHHAIPEAAWPAVYAVLDKLERQPREVSADALAAAGLDGATQETVLGFGALDLAALQARYGTSASAGEAVARFAAYVAHLEALGVGAWVKVDLTIVRGLAYYTGIVFELFDNVGEFRAICGGGRYDNLLGALGGVDLPALGFGMGDVVLGELLRARGLMPAATPSVGVWIAQAPDTPDAPQALLQTATALRASGATVEYALRPQKLDKQLEAGRKAGAGAFVIVDPAHTDSPWRLRRTGHDDQSFTTLPSLVAAVTAARESDR